MNCQVNMQVESHHSSSSVQTEQRIEGEKQRHTTRPSAADSNKQHYIPPSPRRSHSKPSPAQPSPSLIFCCSLLSLTHHQQSQDPASAGADWATVFHGHFRLEIAESHSLPHSRRWCQRVLGEVPDTCAVLSWDWVAARHCPAGLRQRRR